MVFKSEAQLKAFLLPKMKAAVADVEQRVHSTIDNFLNQFYSEWEPSRYIRTSALLHSLVRTGVKSTGNGFVAEIYFETPSYSTGTWSGETVLNVAMESDWPHGGWEAGTPIWSVSMTELGDILSLLVKELNAQGIPIR